MPAPGIHYDSACSVDWPTRANRRPSRVAPVLPIRYGVGTAPVEHPVGFNWKSRRSGLKWIAFSPLMFLWGVMADRTSSDLEYSIQVTLFGAWSVLGVISGIGTIAGASWATSVQRVLVWTLLALFAFCAVAIILILFDILAR